QDRQNIFPHSDRDCFDSIDHNELRDALCQIASSHMRYVPHLFLHGVLSPNVASAYGTTPGITFDRFVCACVVIKQLSGTFQGLGTDNDG
ncbi:hypothetical protein BDR03DRAFT_834304, partial [Suillus americanus]